MTAKERRQLQTVDNQLVEQCYSNLDVPREHIIGCKRLYQCQAQMYFTDYVVLLKSYNTFVAAFDINESTVYDFSRYVYGYTATTAQHVRKFANYMKALQTITYKEVR